MLLWQAVFTSSYLHSSIIFVGVVLFSVYVYSGSDGAPIASIGDVYNNLVIRSKVRGLLPVRHLEFFLRLAGLNGKLQHASNCCL